MATVKLTSCNNAFEAEVLKGVLDSSGIPCILQGAGISGVKIGQFGTYNSAFEVTVLVREEDLVAAIEIINDKDNK